MYIYIKSYLTHIEGVDRYVENDAPPNYHHTEGVEQFNMIRNMSFRFHTFGMEIKVGASFST